MNLKIAVLYFVLYHRLLPYCKVLAIIPSVFLIFSTYWILILGNISNNKMIWKLWLYVCKVLNIQSLLRLFWFALWVIFRWRVLHLHLLYYFICTLLISCLFILFYFFKSRDKRRGELELESMLRNCPACCCGHISSQYFLS